jgi:DNA-directed RNA polymerase specialized sigma24 family protein
VNERNVEQRSRKAGVTRVQIERRLRIALAKMTERQADIFLSIRFDETAYEELSARHGISVDQVTADLASALGMWSRCLHARFPRLVWPWF